MPMARMRDGYRQLGVTCCRGPPKIVGFVVLLVSLKKSRVPLKTDTHTQTETPISFGAGNHLKSAPTASMLRTLRKERPVRFAESRWVPMRFKAALWQCAMGLPEWLPPEFLDFILFGKTMLVVNTESRLA